MTLPVTALAGDAEQIEFFETRIRPVLAAKCFTCHTDTKMGGLRVDSREALVHGGARGPSIEPGDASKSLLIQAVARTHEELKMPPTEALPAEVVADLKAWIDRGAAWPEAVEKEAAKETSEYVIRPETRQFWSYQPVKKSPPPEVKDAMWARSDLDRFILARLEAEQLEPAEQADKRTLIRRATFDLTGLPPTPEEVNAFMDDRSPEAFAKVVDRLLGSPHYGERWGRYWLDLARYGDGLSSAQKDDPLPNAWRYRDWVVGAFNADMPYDRFVKAQLAADLFPEDERDELLPALGFHALRDRDDDRVDVTTRGLLGLTVACAQCHDHKYDPIPTKDYYSLQGVFSSTEPWEYPLAPEVEVEAYQAAQKEIAAKKLQIDKFTEDQTNQLIDILMSQTAEYASAAWQVLTKHAPDAAAAAKESGLDAESLERWVKFLTPQDREYDFLDKWDSLIESGGGSLAEAQEAAAAIQKTVLEIHKEKRGIDDRNYVKLGGEDGVRDQRTLLATNLEFLDPVKWYLWRDFGSGPFKKDGVPFDGGILFYAPKEIKRWLSGSWLDHLKRLEEQLATLEKTSPKPYPFIHGYREAEKAKDIPIAIRGEKDNPGEIAPRRFLMILSEGERERFDQGSGRWQLAEAITAPDNPLTSRVMVNRVWQHHFGRGIVGSPSNYGQLGERPTHPELLDYLAASFVENGWSVKKLHRQIMLSSTYQLSSQFVDENYEKDADNQFYWRANLSKRLDAEALRDAVLAVAGTLDGKLGGPSVPLDKKNDRRTLYALISRTEIDRTMTLFDFPDPKATSEERSVTLGPLQRLYFLNNDFVIKQARALSERLKQEAGESTDARVRRAYELLFARPAQEDELKIARDFLGRDEAAWPRYAQMLLASGEFASIP